MRALGALAFCGLELVLLKPAPVTGLIGFAAVGAGFATIVPLAFTAAGRTPGITAGVALATASTIGYFGCLVGPPLIGLVAEWLSLHGALGLVLVSSTLIIVLAPAVRRAAAPRSLTLVREAEMVRETA